MNVKEAAQGYLEASRSRFLDELIEYVKIPSVSTDDEYSAECDRCATWLGNHLESFGFQIEIRETKGKPVVYGVLQGDLPGPKILAYGHYDVQPADPLELWESPPFEPEMRGERLYGRGAMDNKGQFFPFFKAVEYLKSQAKLPGEIVVLVEGEEECGSVGLEAAIADWAQDIQADILMVSDTGAAPSGAPSVTMGLRGLVALEVVLHGPKSDLHSGQHGGVVKNPAIELARILATLHGEDGRIQIPDFYEGVQPEDAETYKVAGEIPFDDGAYTAQIGVAPTGGERAFEPVVRKGLRPAIDVNGLYSGYTGPGSKAIIPSHAGVKLTIRLVGEQDPSKALERLKGFISEATPEEMRVEFKGGFVGGPALLLNPDEPLLLRARDILTDVSGQQALFLWEGGSIPVVSEVAKLSGAIPVMAGFGLDEDNMHGPNESYSLTQFDQNFLYSVLFLSELTHSENGGAGV